MLKTLCRLCLKKLTEETSVPVSTKHNGELLSRTIFICTSVIAIKEEKEPNAVCATCFETLVKFKRFRKRSIKANQVLARYLETAKNHPDLDNEENILALEMLKDNPRLLPPQTRTNKQIIEEKEKNTDVKTTSDIAKTENIQKDDVVVKIQKGVANAPREIEKAVKRPKPSSYKCNHCGKIYPSEGGWKYHVHVMHSIKFQPFICDLCGKPYKSKRNMEIHKSTVHLGVKEELCDLCGKKFATKYALNKHKMWHSGEKKYECKECKTKYTSASRLNTHMNVHSEFKKFMCEVCSRVFRWKKDFAIHMRTHTGEKPFACKFCHKAFSSCTNMRKHEKGHAFLKSSVKIEIKSTTTAEEPSSTTKSLT